MFRIRGGFGYYGAPGKTGNISDRYTVTGGLGVYIKRFFVDFAYQWSKSEANYYMYDPALVNAADLTTQTNTVSATFGFKF